MGEHQTIGIEPWLEIIEGASPILLIAPHGGRAASDARAPLHPKVNDLHTADITRDLAARMGGPTLINSAMDRNLLDCNRISELAERAPWMLELIAHHLAAILSRHDRATVLIVHGWNIIEPRMDFGVGLKSIGGELRPPGAAHVAAGDEFIHGPMTHLADALRKAGIKPSFGMRYPAGGAQNLLQAFTPRHRESASAPVRAIAELGASGRIDAAQLELSVSCRMPGPVRDRCLDAIESAFAHPRSPRCDADGDAPAIIRDVRPRTSPSPASRAPAPVPTRVGLEFFDINAGFGAMASFDLGPGGFGARIMILDRSPRVALFTGEGRIERTPHGIALGPLKLEERFGAVELSFEGPAVIVPDGADYVSIERALASGHLDPRARVFATFESAGGAFELEKLLAPRAHGATPANAAAFGRVSGEFAIDGRESALTGVGRAGLSFTGLGPTTFLERRMIWACSMNDGDLSAVELRSITADDSAGHRSAREFGPSGWSDARLHSIELFSASPHDQPTDIRAIVHGGSSTPTTIIGKTRSFVALSRPGPDLSRIYTTLGFAEYEIAGARGSGMFEYSRHVDARTHPDADEEPDES